MVKHGLFAVTCADAYDKVCRELPAFRPAQKALAEKLRILSRPSPRLQVLEIGCGTGITTGGIMDALVNLDLLAIDSSPRLASANIRLNPSGSTLTVEKADALAFLKANAIPFRFDFVVSAFTFHNWESDYRLDVLRYVRNALKPGGWFVNVDYYPCDVDSSAEQAFAGHIQSLSQVLERFGDMSITEEWMAHAKDDMHPNKLMRSQESVALMQKLDFAPVAIEHLDELVGILSAKNTGR